MTDKTSNMFITGPQVIKAVTGEDVSAEDLGGSHVHCEKSGVAHFRFADEAATIAGIKRLLSYLPQNNLEDPPLAEPAEPVRGSDRPWRTSSPILRTNPTTFAGSSRRSSTPATSSRSRRTMPRTS